MLFCPDKFSSSYLGAVKFSCSGPFSHFHIMLGSPVYNTFSQLLCHTGSLSPAWSDDLASPRKSQQTVLFLTSLKHSSWWNLSQSLVIFWPFLWPPFKDINTFRNVQRKTLCLIYGTEHPSVSNTHAPQHTNIHLITSYNFLFSKLLSCKTQTALGSFF